MRKGEPQKTSIKTARLNLKTIGSHKKKHV